MASTSFLLRRWASRSGHTPSSGRTADRCVGGLCDTGGVGSWCSRGGDTIPRAHFVGGGGRPSRRRGRGSWRSGDPDAGLALSLFPSSSGRRTGPQLASEHGVASQCRVHVSHPQLRSTRDSCSGMGSDGRGSQLRCIPHSGGDTCPTHSGTFGRPAWADPGSNLATAALVTRLQDDLEAVKAGQTLQAAAGSQGPSALLSAKQLVGAAPKTKAMVGEALRQSKRGKASRGPGGGDELPLDQLLKSACGSSGPKEAEAEGQSNRPSPRLLRLGGRRGRSFEAAKRCQGHNAAREASHGDGERCPGIRQRHTELGSPNLRRGLGRTNHDAQYITDQLPIGSERTLGYMVWGVGRALTLLSAGETAKAHLVLLLLLGAEEQFKVDGTWSSAWRLTHLTPPPFSEWRTKGDQQLAQLRQDHAHTRLCHATWIAAVTAKLKDEEVLTKRRFQPRPSSQIAPTDHLEDVAEAEAPEMRKRPSRDESQSLGGRAGHVVQPCPQV